MVNGNTKAILKVRSGSRTNDIGERVHLWDEIRLFGWLDLSAGGAKYESFNAKIQESDHVFICDYRDLDKDPNGKRLVVNNDEYDVLLIDDPMELHQHLEIYLRLIGGQHNE